MGRRWRPLLVMRRAMGLDALERVAAHRRASEAPTAAEAAAVVDELRRHMAELATAIKALEVQAQQLGSGQAEGGSGANANVAAGDAAAHAEQQVEVIDGLLDGVRRLRAALDQQRDELVVAERRLEDAEGEARGAAEDVDPHAGRSDA